MKQLLPGFMANSPDNCFGVRHSEEMPTVCKVGRSPAGWWEDKVLCWLSLITRQAQNPAG